jgi:DNA-binding response OmpR family regulator
LTAPLICCERHGTWAAVLTGPGKLPHRAVRQTRSPLECLAVLRDAPTATVLVELRPESLDRGLDLLEHVRRFYPRATTLCVAQRGLEPYEVLARELGAVYFSTSPRGARTLVRQLRPFVSEQPGSDDPVAQLLAELPWGEE